MLYRLTGTFSAFRCSRNQSVRWRKHPPCLHRHKNPRTFSRSTFDYGHHMLDLQRESAFWRLRNQKATARHRSTSRSTHPMTDGEPSRSLPSLKSSKKMQPSLTCSTALAWPTWSRECWRLVVEMEPMPWWLRWVSQDLGRSVKPEGSRISVCLHSI